MKAVTVKLSDELHFQTRLSLLKQGKTMQDLVVSLLEEYNSKFTETKDKEHN